MDTLVPRLTGVPEHAAPHPARARAMPRAALGDTWLVYRRVLGPALDLTHARAITAALRGAIMCRAPQPPMEILSGHTSDGRISQRPHVAFVALPTLRMPGRVARRDQVDVGPLAGVALLVPRGLDDREHRHIEATVAPPRERPLCLRLGRAGSWRMEPVIMTPVDDPGLEPSTWLGPAMRWCTVSPAALDRFPGKMFSTDAGARARARDRATEIIAQSCVNIGLPAPVRVRVGPGAGLEGVPASSRFPRFHTGSQSRLLIHAEIVFDQPVCGPVLVGAGRYAGLGLCLPCDGPSHVQGEECV
jgi:CRISPR-associated protein Csb2